MNKNMSKQQIKLKHQQGFTLIELMVVVVILAILAAFAVPQFLDKPDQARIVKAKNDIGAMTTALQLYKLDNFRYPTTDQGIEALSNKPNGEPEAPNWTLYMANLPLDPWGKNYIYLSPGEHGEFDLYTLGADAQEGGEGANGTIANWTIK